MLFFMADFIVFFAGKVCCSETVALQGAVDKNGPGGVAEDIRLPSFYFSGKETPALVIGRGEEMWYQLGK
jgi:hypothetical protein